MRLRAQEDEGGQGRVKDLDLLDIVKEGETGDVERQEREKKREREREQRLAVHDSWESSRAELELYVCAYMYECVYVCVSITLT